MTEDSLQAETVNVESGVMSIQKESNIEVRQAVHVVNYNEKPSGSAGSAQKNTDGPDCEAFLIKRNVGSSDDAIDGMSEVTDGSI